MVLHEERDKLVMTVIWIVACFALAWVAFEAFRYDWRIPNNTPPFEGWCYHENAGTYLRRGEHLVCRDCAAEIDNIA